MWHSESSAVVLHRVIKPKAQLGGKGSTGVGIGGGGTEEDNNEEDEKFCESQEGSVGRGQSVGMDGKPGVRFRKAERKTMRMEQLSIKSGNRVGRKRVFLKETRQKAMEKSLDRVRGKAGGGGDSTGQRCAGELSD